MSRPARPRVKLEEEPLWKLANEVAEEVYKVLPEIPEEEKWDTAVKLRTAANNMLFSVGEAVGNGGPATMEYEWGDARKYMAALKTMYRFAGRQHFIEIDPELMVKLDKGMQIIDDELRKSYELTEKANQDELEMWRDRYRLWKEKTEGL